ncbi:2369_t:CDS:2 [Funneliformis geosporum]|nr:2369_t:CDS:2 [Funneliformis geosporum]
MKEVIIIETNNGAKLKNFLNQEHFVYKVYQKPTISKEIDIFANYDNMDENEEPNKDDFEVPVMVNKKEGLAILDQIKTVDKSRLIKKLGKLTEKEMLIIRERIDLVFD